jgi:predicted ATPase
MLDAVQKSCFRHIITGDENWFYLEYQHASQESVSRDEVPQRVNPAIGTANFVSTAI